MVAVEWIVIGLLVLLSAVYTARRLWPRRLGGTGGGCKSCPASGHAQADGRNGINAGASAPSQRTDEPPR
jgi:hypothetical protein